MGSFCRFRLRVLVLLLLLFPLSGVHDADARRDLRVRPMAYTRCDKVGSVCVDFMWTNRKRGSEKLRLRQLKPTGKWQDKWTLKPIFLFSDLEVQEGVIVGTNQVLAFRNKDFIVFYSLDGKILKTHKLSDFLSKKVIEGMRKKLTNPRWFISFVEIHQQDYPGYGRVQVNLYKNGTPANVEYKRRILKEKTSEVIQLIFDSRTGAFLEKK